MDEVVATREEAAKALRLSLRTLDKLIAEGRILVRRVGRRVLIPRTEIQRFAIVHTEAGSVQKTASKMSESDS